jgi:hypothetical protein
MDFTGIRVAPKTGGRILPVMNFLEREAIVFSRLSKGKKSSKFNKSLIYEILKLETGSCLFIIHLHSNS